MNRSMAVSLAGVAAGLSFSLALVPSALADGPDASLESLARQGAAKGWTFHVGPSDALKIPLEKRTGLKLPSDWRSKVQFVHLAQPSALPSHFDWREETANGLTPIKNQGACGSCWAFASAGTFENVLRVRDGKTEDVSEQYLLSCNKEGYSCAGGFWAFDLFKSPQGAVLGSEMPYRARKGMCWGKHDYQEHIENWSFIASDENSVPPTDDIKAAILDHGPIAVGVDATNSFSAYKDGVFNDCTQGDINHAVILVGWDDDTGSWIMRNSWGADWGEKGYMRIKYGCNSIGYGASYVNYKPACSPQPAAVAGENQVLSAGSDGVRLGAAAADGTTYSWSPAEGLSDAHAANPVARPAKDTVYTVHATTSCGTAVKSVKVSVSGH